MPHFRIVGNIPNFMTNLLNRKGSDAKPTGETCAELYERLNVGRGMTLRNFQERFNGKNEVRFSMRREVSAKEVAIMEGLYPPIKDKMKRVADKAAVSTPESNVVPGATSKKVVKKVDWIRVFALIVSSTIICGHAVLVWYDCSILWGSPGFIAGIVVFSMIVFGMLTMASKAMKDVVENVAWVVWTLEGAAIFVHVPSFTQNATVAYSRGLGELHTWLLSGIICFCSIAATSFFKETILLNTEKSKK